MLALVQRSHQKSDCTIPKKVFVFLLSCFIRQLQIKAVWDYYAYYSAMACAIIAKHTKFLSAKVHTKNYHLKST